MFVSLNILKKEFPGESYVIIIPIIATFFVWYIVTIYRSTLPNTIKHGQESFKMTNVFYGVLLIFLLPLIWLLIL